MTGGAAPAKRDDAEDDALDLGHRAISHRRQIRNEADIPKEQRDGEIGGHREHVPDQRASELRPDVHRVRIRKQPVRREPWAARMNDRIDCGAHDGEDCHCLRAAADGHAPLLLEEKQNRRDERARVTDTDPPHEVDDGKCPAHGNVRSPDADAFHEQVSHCDVQTQEQHCADAEPQQPAKWRPLRQRNLRNRFGDALEVVAGCNHRRLEHGGGPGLRTNMGCH